MLDEKIRSFLAKNETPAPEIMEPAIQEACLSLEESIRKHFGDERNQSRNAVSGSSAGRCVRQLAYRYHGFDEEPLSPRARTTLFLGDLYEIVVVMLLRFSGVPIQDRQKEVEKDGLKGHIDFNLVDKKKKTVYDVKSHSSFGFDRENKEGISDTFGYATQGAFYKEAEGADEFRHLNINKNTGELADVALQPTISTKALLKMALKRKERVEKSTPDKLPPREHEALLEKSTGRLYLDVPCQYCAFKNHCWEINEAKPIRGTYVREYVS